MQLEKARQKLANFEVEIRRTYRAKVFRQIRQELTMPQAELVNKLFKQFVDNKQSQIPEICLSHYKHIELSHLSQLITAMQNKHVCYTSKTEDKWYIDCTSIVNIKFMSLQEIVICPNILMDFFRETVRINYEKISSFQRALKNKRQGCMFNIVEKQSSGELEIPNLYQNQQSQNLQYEVGLLNFWSSYIQKTEDSILRETFVEMMKVFKIQTQFNDVLLKREACIFIKTILQHIKDSNILADYSKTLSKNYQLAHQCYSFITFVKMKMPFLVKKAVDYRLAYYQIAQILYKFYQLSQQHIDVLFSTCVTEIQSLNYFIILLLRDESVPQDTNLNHNTALLVINCIAEKGIYDLLYLNQAINITRQLVNVTLFDRTTQHLCSLVLFNIIDRDREKYLLKIFELLDYETLLENLQEGSYNEVYELLILILQNYHKSNIICTKILIDSEFISRLKKYSLNKDIEKLLEELTRVIRMHLNYFLDKYPTIIIELYQLIKQHDFKHRDQCIKELQAHFQLACKQKEL